jgi:predicted phage tail protein|tara:strand:- start:600 stop:3926 length:3327 start_codon:yes stop_codon:yes gene_type:complete
MNKHFQIQGAGGGGGGKGGGRSSRTPIESDDTLQSEQFAHVLDLLCEGEIEGLDDGSKSIFLDDTPVSNADGSYNFQNFVIVTRNGTQAQSYIPVPAGGGNIESEQNVGIKVENGTPITRQITDTDIDRVRVTTNVPSLQRITDDGDILGHSVSLRIDIQYNGGGFNTYLSDTISGKNSSLYQRDYIIDLDGSFPVDIRVIRTSANESSSKKSSDIFWSSYTEIQDDKLRYPNSAIVGLRFSAKQFSSVPTRKYLIRGMKVKIPSNATVDTTTHLGRITYSGTWDGTFQAATWTNDPAWCLYDLLIDQRRYGVGVDESTLDKFDFFSVSQYCNSLVDDGKGGQEPRFSLNILINSRDEVFNVIQQLTSVFRGIAYYGAGSLVLRQDKPTDAQYLLGPTNVIDGVFSYSGTAEKTRHTCATVGWQSYDNLGEIEYEYVEDAEAVAKYGIINKDIRALGCYSQGQAHRLGKWTLLSEKNLTETCSFGVAIDSGIVLTPGMVVDIADPLRAGTRRSGRVSSATTTAITVDSDTNLSVTLTENPTISVMMPTGLVETRSISTIAGTVVTVSSAFSEAPKNAAVWLIQTTDIQSQQFRVVSVTDNNDGTVGVTALAYNQSIYNAIEQDVSLTARDITNLTGIPAAVTDIKGAEFLYQEGQTVHTGFDLSWSHARLNVNEFEVKYRLDDDNFEQVTTASPSITLRALRAGTLKVQIIAKNYLGKQSETSTSTFELVGKTAPPGDVQNLSIEAISANTARLKWDQALDLDVKVGGKVHVRHSSLTNGTATFSNSVDLINAIPGSSTDVAVPLLEGEYILKFADDGGRLSTNDASVLVDIPDSVGLEGLISHREDQLSPPFPGTKTNCFYSDDETALTLEGKDNIDDMTDFDSIPVIDFLGDIVSSGTYLFQDTVDFGVAFSAIELRRRFVTRGFFPSDRVDARTALIDTWQDIDGGIIQSVNAEMYVRTTNDDPTGTPTYSAWIPFNSGTFSARAFQFKAELTSSKVDENILIDQMGYEVLLQPRSDHSNAAIASGTSTKSVTFNKRFFVGTATVGGLNTLLPSVGVVVQNLGDGERVNVSNVSATGFDLDVLDSSGSNVNRNFTYAANGYGRGI